MSRVCSDCGCDERMHNEPPTRACDGKNCSAKDAAGRLAHMNYCTRGFTTAVGGSNSRVCTHVNGHKSFCPQYEKEICICFNGRSRFCTVHNAP